MKPQRKPRCRMGILPDSCSISIHHFAPFVTTRGANYTFFLNSPSFLQELAIPERRQKKGGIRKNTKCGILYIWYGMHLVKCGKAQRFWRIFETRIL